jgi:hypothetical protein
VGDGFPNKPKILRGAFVEFGLSLPPLIVVFQYNPLQLTRNRTLSFGVSNGGSGASGGCGGTGGGAGGGSARSLRKLHGETSNLLELQERQTVTVSEQSIGFELRLDATDGLDDGEGISEQLGIGPQLATLERMVYPKSESLIGQLGSLLGKPAAFSFTRSGNPPMILFIFGRKRVLPVNIDSMKITETDFSADLNPVRATVAVSLTVIEGKSVPYLYTQAMTEAMSAVNLANIADVANVVVPG